MPTVNQIRDTEIVRQKRNMTDSQKKKADATKEAVVVNELVKEPKNIDMNDLYDSLIISDDVKMPERLNESRSIEEKSIMLISFIATGVMAAIAGLSFLVKTSTNIKSNPNAKPEHELDDIIRNVNITKEEVQGVYQIFHCPTKKTILAGIGVITLGAMAFMGKMFIDGFKEVWVKKKEADIQKNLQENLVAVETQSFSGKIQIIRSILSDKANEFSEYLCSAIENKPSSKCFKNNLAFKAKNDNTNKQSNLSNLKYFAIGTLTLASIIGLAFLSMKNLIKGKKGLEEHIKLKKDIASKIINSSNDSTKEKDKTILKKILQDISATSEDIKNMLSKLKWKDSSETDKFINEVIFSIQKSTTEAPDALKGSGTPKPAFNSYIISDYKAFFYNYLLDSENPQFKWLFWGITGLSAFAYGGKALGEAIKEIQVKKMNAQTELELQQKLVATELRNFKAKKDAAINPLCEEFYVQLKKGKPKEELKVIAENILFEVKNGPPFVYS